MAHLASIPKTALADLYTREGSNHNNMQIINYSPTASVFACNPRDRAHAQMIITLLRTGATLWNY